MERKKLKQILEQYYSHDSVKSLLMGRMRPTLLKAIYLEKQHNIPCYAWYDIKSYLQKQNTSSTNEEEKVS